MRAMQILFLLPAFLFSQAYYEASGQTVAFNLTAGATAAWNAGVIKTEAHAALPAQPSLTVYPNPSRGNVCFQVQGNRAGVTAIIYNLQGKKMQALDFAKRSAVTLAAGLSNGIYFARLQIHGRTVQTTRFLVVR